MKIYIETYGCRMNICDSEIILSILISDGNSVCSKIEDADVIIFNSCSVRETGHEKTYSRLAFLDKHLLHNRIIVICGCFATQVNDSLFKRFPFVDIVIGPDSYRKLPLLLRERKKHVILKDKNYEEMYSDVVPVRTIEDKTTAAITVMKGCNQSCSYCIEPFTRGRESSRDMRSILQECTRIVKLGYKEITFVGHIIDKYSYGFAKLLNRAASSCPSVRFKFLSSHPSTLTNDIIDAIKQNDNIMRVIHLPVQSGSDKVLMRMRRGYTVKQYRERYKSIKNSIPDIHIVTDIMVGFCGETIPEFEETIALIHDLQFDDINVFRFSMRQGTAAANLYTDNVPSEEKHRRYQYVVDLKNNIKHHKYLSCIGQTEQLYNEGLWKENPAYHFGRDRFLRTIIFKGKNNMHINDTVVVRIKDAKYQYLIGEMI